MTLHELRALLIYRGYETGWLTSSERLLVRTVVGGMTLDADSALWYTRMRDQLDEDFPVRQLELRCSRCDEMWHISRRDAELYAPRVAENVCWSCESEGW